MPFDLFSGAEGPSGDQESPEELLSLLMGATATDSTDCFARYGP